MRLLVTGITGMTGSHLAELLLKRNHEVIGVIREHSSLDNVAHFLHDIDLIRVDMLDTESVSQGIQRLHPDGIFHLAAQTHVAESWHMSSNTLATNIIPVVNILEAVRRQRLETVVHVASSSEVYGRVSPPDNPVSETTITRPANPYAVSKLMQEYTAHQYFSRYDIKTIVTRAFNHTGPRRREQFVESHLAKQFAEMQLGLRKPVIVIGNLESRRDFTDVRDVARAYLDLVDSHQYGETFNVCSGHPIKIAQILTRLREMTGINPQVVQDPSRLRASDHPVVYGSFDKLHHATGWQPTYDFTSTLKDLIDHWRLVLSTASTDQLSAGSSVRQ